MMMRSNPRLQRFVDNARWVVADGQPLVWMARLAGTPIPERVTGMDLVDCLCAEAQREGFGVYFLGGTDDTVTSATVAMQRKYPALRICGRANGYFGDSEASARARAVADSGAKLLFAGMGVPRQEIGRAHV